MKITRKHFIRSLAGIAGAGFCFGQTAGVTGKKDPLAMKELGRTGIEGISMTKPVKAAVGLMQNV